MAGNEVRIHARVRDDATKPIKGIDDALHRLQKRGAQGIITGAAATATFAAFSLIQSGIRGVTDALGDAVRAAIEDEASQKRLEASLRANIPAWDGSTKAIQDQIDARMALGFSDDQLRGSLTLLVAATNDVSRALDIQRTAMDLARFKGVDLETATSALIKVEGGRYRALIEMGIQLEKGATQEQAMAAVRAAAAGQAETFARTTAGAMEAASVAVNELSEDIGEALAPAVLGVANYIRTDLIPALREAGEVIQTTADAVGWFLERVKDVTPGVRASEAALADYISRAAELGAAEARQRAAFQDLTLALRDLQFAFADGIITEEEHRAKSDEVLAAYERRISMAERHIATTDAESQEMARALWAWEATRVAIADVAAVTPRASDAMAIFGSTLQTTAGWALALGNAMRGVNASVSADDRSQIAPGYGPEPFVPRRPRGGGGGASSAQSAAQKRRDEEVRAEREALDAMREAGEEYFDAVHERNMDIIDEAHRVAREKIDASYDATMRQIDNDHKVAQKAIEEAHRAANAQIAEERRAIDAKLGEQRRLNRAPVTAAEQAQAQIENDRRERDLREELAEARKSGDKQRIRSAEEALQSFEAQMAIEAMRAAADSADIAAEKSAEAAQAELDAREEAERARYESQQESEDAIYENRKAEEEAAYKARQAAEDATYQRRKKDEDARWALVKERFAANVDALRDSKDVNTRLAQIETLRYLQEKRRLAAAAGASAFELQRIDEQIGRVEKGIPKHAAGLGYVPNDNYLAYLHRGEMIVPEGPATALRNGGLGGTVTIASGAIVINGAGRNADVIASEVIHKIERRMTQQRVSSLVRR